MVRCMGIASGKGGTGKTTTAINLACALTNFGHDVVLIDANLNTPHVGVHLGAPVLPNTLNKALKGEISIRESAYLHPSGIKVIPASIHVDEAKEDGLEKLKHVLVDLAETTQIAVLDLGSGSTQGTMQALSACDELVLVVNPELPSLTDALRTKHLAEQYGVKILGAVVNKKAGIPGELSKENIEKLLDVQVLDHIPHDEFVFKALAMKQPVVYAYPEAPASIGFKKVAALLVGQQYRPESRKAPMQNPDLVDRFLDKMKGLQEEMGKRKK